MSAPSPRELPRLVVAAPASGHGKTTVATGLMAALRRAGHRVSGHKVGPDYIDPGYHALATGRPGRNLDPFLVGEDRIVPLLRHGAAGCDVAVVEGVMGLYDGRLGTDGEASTAQVAALIDAPVLLVVDVRHASRTHAALVHGLATFDPRVRVGGVVLNQVGSPRHGEEVRRALAGLGIPVLGALPRDAGLETPSRHLGLVPAAERHRSADTIDRLAASIAQHVDIEAVLRLARSAPPLPDVGAWDPVDELSELSERGKRGKRGELSELSELAPVPARRPVVAMAAGRAFTFRYAETEELLRAAGCEVVEVDPLTDRALPAGTTGLYLGGGFPEVHAAELGDNAPLLAELRTRIAAGLPTVAECAGMLYLSRSVDGVPAVGVIEATAAMTPRLTLGYRTATAAGDSLLTRAGETVTGHEFHRTAVTPETPAGPEAAAWLLPRADGLATATVHASYLHVHWAGHPHLAARFAKAAAQLPNENSFGESRRPSTARPSHGEPGTPSFTERSDAPDVLHPLHAPNENSFGTVDLHHHGDREAGSDLVDFAVNVFAGPRPTWLTEALHAAIEASTRYPDATAARAAIARRHDRPADEVLPTAGAAEAFTLVARARAWRRPVVVHPGFTEPHAALVQAGHEVTTVLTGAEDGFRLDPDRVPADADLVVIGNPTNPTGVVHPAATIRALLGPGRTVLVDEAFLDAVPGEPEALVAERAAGLLVTRSLTKHWSIPGIRAGYLVGDPELIALAAAAQPPWSLSTPATAAIEACLTDQAQHEAASRAEELARWRRHLTDGLDALAIEHVTGLAPYVLARVGPGEHARLRERGIAVRRCDTFPGLDDSWVRIAVRPPHVSDSLLDALSPTRTHALG